jgi:hypothetical protein
MDYGNPTRAPVQKASRVDAGIRDPISVHFKHQELSPSLDEKVVPSSAARPANELVRVVVIAKSDTRLSQLFRYRPRGLDKRFELRIFLGPDSANCDVIAAESLVEFNFRLRMVSQAVEGPVSRRTYEAVRIQEFSSVCRAHFWQISIHALDRGKLNALVSDFVDDSERQIKCIPGFGVVAKRVQLCADLH